MVGGKLEELLQPDQGLRVLVQDGEHPPPVGEDQVPVGQRYGGRVGAEIDGVSLQLLGHHVPSGGDVGNLKVWFTTPPKNNKMLSVYRDHCTTYDLLDQF